MSVSNYVDWRIRRTREEINTLRGVVNINKTTERGLWATGTMYALNDYARVQGTLWRCNTPHVAGSTFLADVAKWTPTVVNAPGPILPRVGNAIGPSHVGATTNATLAFNVLSSYPQVIPIGSATYDAVQFVITTAATVGSGAGLTFKGALYPEKLDGTVGPDSTQTPIVTFSTTPTQATGITTVTFASALVNPPPGRYWWELLYTYSTAPTTSPSLIVVSTGHGAGGMEFAMTASALQPPRCLSATGQSDLPAAGNAGPTLNPNAGAVSPIVVMRRSA